MVVLEAEIPQAHDVLLAGQIVQLVAVIRAHCGL
jgi:hypothetical protein